MSEQTATVVKPRRHWSGNNPDESGNRPVIKATGNPDRLMAKAKRLVVDNYNAHHDKEKTPPLRRDQVKIVFFSMMGRDFNAIVESSVVHGVLYHVEYTAMNSSAIIEVFKRVNIVRISE